MKISQNKLEEFYKKLFSIYVEWEKSETGINSYWNDKRYCLYQSGPVVGKYRENDPELLEIIECNYCIQDIVEAVLPEIDSQMQEYENKDLLNTWEKLQYESYVKQYKLLTGTNPKQWLTEYFESTMKGVGVVIDENIIMGFCVVYYGYLNYYKRISSIYNSDCDNLKTLYMHIYAKESSLYKYNLIDMVNDCELMPIEPPRIYDGRVNKTLFTSNIPRELLAVLNELNAMKFFGKLAIRVSNLQSKIFDGRYDLQSIMEAKEYGHFFSTKNLISVPITKLYSKEYGNTLWIKVMETDITFEELCKNDESVNSSIVTQVIHLQYRKENTSIIITHIDHEFVFYEKNEYESRKRNAIIKATKYTRLKSFKIDKSNIPFDYAITRKINVFSETLKKDVVIEENVPFLIYVLKCYFKHHDLIDEYFQNIK